MLYSELKSIFVVSINVSVIAIMSKFSVKARHFSSSNLFLRLRALKLRIFKLSRGLVIEVVVLAGSRLRVCCDARSLFTRVGWRDVAVTRFLLG